MTVSWWGGPAPRPILAPDELIDEVRWLSAVEGGLRDMGAKINERSYDPEYNEGMPEPRVGAFCYMLVWPNGVRVRYVLNMSVFQADFRPGDVLFDVQRRAENAANVDRYGVGPLGW